MRKPTSPTLLFTIVMMVTLLALTFAGVDEKWLGAAIAAFFIAGMLYGRYRDGKLPSKLRLLIMLVANIILLILLFTVSKTVADRFMLIGLLIGLRLVVWVYDTIGWEKITRHGPALGPADQSKPERDHSLLSESAQYLLQSGYFTECRDAPINECIKHHFWQEMHQERLSGEQYQMEISFCGQCNRYWFEYFYQHQGSGEGCSFWMVPAVPGEVEAIMQKKATAGPEEFYGYIRGYEPSCKTKYVRDGIVCLAPASYPWG